MRRWVVLVLMLSLGALPCHAALSTDFVPVEKDLEKTEQPPARSMEQAVVTPAESAAPPEAKKETNWLLWGILGAVVVGGGAALALGGGGGGGGGGGSGGGGTQTGSVEVSW